MPRGDTQEEGECLGGYQTGTRMCLHASEELSLLGLDHVAEFIAAKFAKPKTPRIASLRDFDHGPHLRCLLLPPDRESPAIHCLSHCCSQLVHSWSSLVTVFNGKHCTCSIKS